MEDIVLTSSDSQNTAKTAVNELASPTRLEAWFLLCRLPNVEAQYVGGELQTKVAQSARKLSVRGTNGVGRVGTVLTLGSVPLISPDECCPTIRRVRVLVRGSPRGDGQKVVSQEREPEESPIRTT